MPPSSYANKTFGDSSFNLLANTKYTYLISSTIETNEPLHYNSQMKVLVFKTPASGGKRKRKTKRRKTLRIITRKRL